MIFSVLYILPYIRHEVFPEIPPRLSPGTLSKILAVVNSVFFRLHIPLRVYYELDLWIRLRFASVVYLGISFGVPKILRNRNPRQKPSRKSWKSCQIILIRIFFSCISWRLPEPIDKIIRVASLGKTFREKSLKNKSIEIQNCRSNPWSNYRSSCWRICMEIFSRNFWRIIR